ncbi:MAG: hypothetical protein OXE79_10705 [Acidimicrobiaceae bacterium]|nr:hypothetical protein [Acidimicrobiaceae bacterium]MCY4279561.1 hypothetical protein [Acidimicrobiaceae bacterium]MCY4295285.1 hypothetical protein [Acidimicrobiaceae bacterium]
MGTFTCPLRLTSPDRERTLDLEALVDTGAFYTHAPASLLDELGIARNENVSLEFADGRIGRYDMGEARASINGKSVTTLVVFGDDGAKPLLGAYTLEGLNLAVDPVHQRLLPIEKRTI